MKKLASLLAALLLLVAAPASLWAADLTTVVTFNPAAGELPEGIAIDRQENIYVGLAPTGEIRRITPAGRASTFARLPAPGEGFMTGLAFDQFGYLYVALASFDPATHGIWWVSPDGREMQHWVPLPVTSLPNGLAFRGDDVLVSDSTQGQVWAIDKWGNAGVWVQSDLLMGDPALSPLPLPIGANGLAFLGNHLYVANTNFGRIVRIPLLRDGTAGAEEIVAEDFETLAGADGIAFDAQGNLYVAVNKLDSIIAVSWDGQLMTLAQGDPLQNPASLAIRGGTVYITNLAIFHPEGSQQPSLLSMPTIPATAAPAQVPAQ